MISALLSTLGVVAAESLLPFFLGGAGDALEEFADFRLGVMIGLEGPGGRASCGDWAGTGDFFF